MTLPFIFGSHKKALGHELSEKDKFYTTGKYFWLSIFSFVQTEYNLRINGLRQAIARQLIMLIFLALP